MLYKKFVMCLSLVSVTSVSATILPPIIVPQPARQQRCDNCNAIRASVSVIMRSFNGDHRFYHLQSQFGEAAFRQPCFCTQRPALVTALRQELVRLWPQASQETIQDLRAIDELHYDAELNFTR